MIDSFIQQMVDVERRTVVYYQRAVA